MVLSLGAQRADRRRAAVFPESRVRDNISIAAMFTPFYRGNWWNVTKGMLLRSVYMILWACTIIGFPGQNFTPTAWYRISLRRNPQAKPTEAIQLSRQMMNGNKWRCFVLDLTLYLHWAFLPTLLASILGTGIGMLTGRIVLCQSIATVAVGLLSLLFVNGYKSAAYTALYAALRQAQRDADAPLSSPVYRSGLWRSAPTGAKPRLPDADVHLPEDPVFHFAQQHKLNYNRRYSLRTLILLFFAFSIAGWLWEGRAAHRHQGHVCQPRHPCSAVAADLRRRPARSCCFCSAGCLPKPVGDLLCIHGAVLDHRDFTSWYLEVTKGIRWWDYSGYFMNLNGRICLEGAVTFGLACCAVVYFAGPLLAGLIEKLSPAKQNADLRRADRAVCSRRGVLALPHPNAGEGITDYNDWQADGSDAEAAAALTASNAPIRG